MEGGAMRMRLLLAAVSGLLFAGASSARVDDVTDRFTGERSLRYFSEAKAVDGAPRITLIAGIKDGEVRASVSFLVESLSYSRSPKSGWKYLRCHSVAWLLDGKQLDLGSSTHDGEVFRGGVSEVVMQRMTWEHIQQFAGASVVEYKICNDEYRVSEQDMAGIRDFADRVRSAM